MELGDLLVEQDTDDAIKSEFHTLFIEKKRDSYTLELPEDAAEQIGVPQIEVEGQEYTNYTLYLSTFMSDANDTARMMHKLRSSEDDKDELTVYIDSPGGSIYEGVKIISTMRGLFKGRTTTILDPSGSSMGALMFCAGDTRVIPEFGYLMFHNYSTGAFGKGQEVLADIEFSDPHVKKIFRDLITKKGFFTEDEYKALITGTDFYFDAEDACLNGMATHVHLGEYMVEAEQYIDYIETGFDTFEEYIEYKTEEMTELVTEQIKEQLIIGEDDER
jgi:ATP-dependent Clp protease protease subunit